MNATTILLGLSLFSFSLDAKTHTLLPYTDTDTFISSINNLANNFQGVYFENSLSESTSKDGMDNTSNIDDILNKDLGYKNRNDSQIDPVNIDPVIHSIIINNYHNFEIIEVRFHLLHAMPIKLSIHDAKGELLQTYFAKGMQDANVLHLSTKTLNTGTYQLIMDVQDTKVFRKVTIDKQQQSKSPRA